MYLNYITFNNSFEIGGKYVLREEKVEFDKAEQTFYITFNNTKAYLDMRTIILKNFRFKFKGKSLKTTNIDKESGRVFKIKVESYDGSLIDINSENIDQLSYKLKRIKDVIGREIYQHETVKGDQFREFFVQQINVNKSTSDGIVVMDKNLPIKDSFLNEFPDKDHYWLNTPLMD